MSYANADARRDILDSVADATDQLSVSTACIGEAFETVDVITQDKIEEELFGPLQRAVARANRMYAGFAQRTGVEGRELRPGAPSGTPSQGAHGYIEQASTAIGRADLHLAELQDSMLPVEVGDEALRADIAAVREGLDGLAEAARDVRRRLGR